MRDKSTPKKSLCQVPTTNENDPLTSAAQAIVGTFKSPLEFLHFLNDALGWVYDYGIAQGDSHPGNTHFVLRQIIQEIATPWLSGGSDCTESIAAGCGEVASIVSYDNALEEVKYLIKAQAWFKSELGTSTLDSEMLDAEGIICLLNVMLLIHQFNLSKQTSKL